MHHVIQWSGGIGSWATTELVRREHPDDPITLLFADVKVEDSDLYRFNADASTRLGIPITRVCDGRTPFELFVQRSYLGNARIAPCSQALKQKPCRRWLTEHTDPADTVLYVGLEPDEQRRAPAITAGWRPWLVDYPLMQQPGLTKDDLLTWCRNAGLKPPRLYCSGYSHNNCGGLCVRGARLTGAAPGRSSPIDSPGTPSSNTTSAPPTEMWRSSSTATTARPTRCRCAIWAPARRSHRLSPSWTSNTFCACSDSANGLKIVDAVSKWDPATAEIGPGDVSACPSRS
ncbi:hypothetical protein ACIOD2_47265 [Amycolatopsis sp. NPDC088138]|uniref:hypothetical protein n=1 Tax=Amycolatopsis sp. NPDC088138 TaxID=3363938 RepID=UPI0037F74384